MKFFPRFVLLALLFATLAASALAQSPSPGTSGNSPDSIKSETHTATGRIVKLDTKSRIFSVHVGASGKVLDLQADKSVDINALRRGERVTVTYAGDVALKVQATRSEK